MNKPFPLIYTVVMVLLPFAYAGYLYPFLPEQIPVHFNLQGEADNWSGKACIFFSPVILGLVSLFSFLLMTNIKKFDPKRYLKGEEKVFSQFSLFLVSFLTLLSLSILYSTSHFSGTLKNFIFPLLGIAFAGIGYFLPQLRPNYFVGFRLPWTLENEVNWESTHQLAGKIWKLGGFLQLVGGIWLEGRLGFYFFIFLVLLMVLIPAAYSFWKFKSMAD